MNLVTVILLVKLKLFIITETFQANLKKMLDVMKPSPHHKNFKFVFYFGKKFKLRLLRFAFLT